MQKKTVLVVGASGFVGSAAVARFATEGCDVIGMSRRAPAFPVPGVRYLAVDLRDRLACLQAVGSLATVTHLVFAAVNETPGDLITSWTDPEHAQRNAGMLVNVMDGLLDVAQGLRQILLVHGTKAYATHLADRSKVPLLESMSRPSHDDFYFRQEDYLWSRRKGAEWHWTVLRAPMIAGGAHGSNLNALLALGVFASLLKQERADLPFPGSSDNLGVMEMVDVELLAKAISWASATPAAADQTFNVANGDCYVWPDLWPVIANEFGMTVGPARPTSIRDEVFGRAERWGALVRRHALLAPQDLREYLGESCSLADFALNNCSRSVLTSTIKIRQAGFHECVDTSASVAHWIRRWRDNGLLPR